VSYRQIDNRPGGQPGLLSFIPGEELERIETKFTVGTKRFPVTLEYEKGRIYFVFKYNPAMIAEIKAMDGHKWHGYEDPPRKVWSVKDNQRNRFQIDYYMGKDPYGKFDKPLVDVDIKPRYNKALKREVMPYDHQIEMIRHALTRRYCLFACEMGTGKSLAALITMELTGDDEWWFVGPTSAIMAVTLECDIWGVKVLPKMFTYDKLRSVMAKWPEGQKAPRRVVFDESSRVKTPTAQRSQAALALAEGVREDHGDNGMVILMSGSPAPKSPPDWWNQCISADSWILTKEGPRQVKDLIGIPFEARIDGRNHKSNGFWRTGYRDDVSEIETNEGYRLKATSNHRVLRDTFGIRDWVEVKNLNPGDEIVLNTNNRPSWSGTGSYTDGYLIGQLMGDGNVYRQDNKLYGRLKFHQDDFCVIGYAESCFPDKIKFCYDEKTNSFSTYSEYLTHLISTYGLDESKQISPIIEAESSDFLAGMLSGLFDSDGHIEKSRLRVEFAQTDLERILAVQRILNYFGINSDIKHRKANFSYIGERKINSKKAFKLHITSENAVRFATLIGFNHPTKSDELRKRLTNKHSWQAKSTATVKTLTPVDAMDVFDCEVANVHCFSANGLIVHNCEIACPGFLREGTYRKFQDRLGLIVQKESIATGGVYPHLVTWKDDANKCNICGQFAAHPQHDPNGAIFDAQNQYHIFQPSVNEVATLYKRMTGLVLVKLKKDCLSLPEKVYREIICKPAQQTLNAAKIIAASARTSIQALTLLRELSDGFQYREEKDGTIDCPHCSGAGKSVEWVGEGDQVLDPNLVPEETWNEWLETKVIRKELTTCPNCLGEKLIDKLIRTTISVPCPKEDALIDFLDLMEDGGRAVTFAGFTGSIDRVQEVCNRMDWSTIRVDGRGWVVTDPKGKVLDDDPLKLFQVGSRERVAFVGHPESGGMGVTLTRSPAIFYYSNDFKAENRIQSEDRIHRPGMDINRGATIFDCLHLPTDRLVLDNLRKKRDLQAMSLGQVSAGIDYSGERIL
jgi:intein/homing endonuclease